MCGISAFIGNELAINFLLFSLKILENRGYDSAGICCIDKNKNFIIRKEVSDNINAIKKLEKNKKIFNESNIGIAHTRWATTGEKNICNSHPHFDNDKNFSVVHNGIIENYEELKKELNDEGIKMNTETDTEIIVQYINYYYKKNRNVKESIKKVIKKLRGTWALVILCKDEENKIFCTRKGSPLLLGIADEYIMVSSEQSGFCNFVEKYICLKNDDIIEITNDNNKNKIIFDVDSIENYKKFKISQKIDTLEPYPYKHWMIKEIEEQKESIKRAINNGGRIENEEKVKLGGLIKIKNKLKNIDNIILLGCGTSYNAANICKNRIKNITNINDVYVYDGSEFTEKELSNRNNLVIFLSQSGETKDLYTCLEICKKRNNVITLGIINSVDSLIAREVECGVYLNADREISVASTKSFTSQILVIHLVSIYIAQIKNINIEIRKNIIYDIKKLSQNIDELIKKYKNVCIDISKKIYRKNNLFILGKSNYEYVAKEGALKIKEVSYIHAEGYSSSALKHGTYALIEKETPIIIILSKDKNYDKNKSIINELKLRNAQVITITNSNYIDDDITNIYLDIDNITFFDIFASIILQLIAYYTSIKKNINPDYPRNLSKSITTD